MISKATPEFHQPHQLPPLRILIVEDDPVMQLGLEQFFEQKSQFQVVGIAADGYQGVEAAERLKNIQMRGYSAPFWHRS